MRLAEDMNTIKPMPRRNRCVLPGIACHITQRGVNRCEIFTSVEDRETYLRLMRENVDDAAVSILGWCLMSNHVHLIAVPGRADSLGVLLRRVHGRYAQYYNARWGRTGHLWQNRFFACLLGPGHLWAALAYVDRNPVRAAMVKAAGEYRWSSATAHLSGHDDMHGLTDMAWWRKDAPPDWDRSLADDGAEFATRLRDCTYAGRPCGGDEFLIDMEERFGRQWRHALPKQAPSRVTAEFPDVQECVLL